LYYELLRALRNGTVGRIAQSVIDSPVLDDSSKAQLTLVINTAADLAEVQKARARTREIDQYLSTRIDAFVAEKTREQKESHDAAVMASARVRSECIVQFRRQLERQLATTRIEDFVPAGDSSLHQELEDIRKHHEYELQKAQERTWWQNVATHSTAAVVGRLRNVPSEYVQRVLDALLQLPTTDPYVHDENVHRFLERQHQLIAHGRVVNTPVFVAHIGRLLGEGDYTKARELLDLFPVADRSPLSSIVNYFRYVLSEGPDLSGVTDYRSLSAEDLFLGACYYYEPSSSAMPKPPCAWPTLKRQWQWEYQFVERALLDATRGGDTQYLNDFKVSGLQPRIAELAFHRVYGRLHGTCAERKLRDLNLERIKQLAPPWKLDSRPTLPSADWEDSDGQKYDVKSNLYYRSKEAKSGLRGLFIRRSKNPNHSFPGFVFTGTDEESCSWVYVGEYQSIATIRQLGDRVLPFCFRLPDSCRYSVSKSDPGRSLGMPLLKDSWLRIGWQLAAGVQVAPSQSSPSIAQALLHTFVSRCIHEATATFLEHALWKALTDTTLDACCEYNREDVESFLRLANELFLSRALPIRLPRIAETPLLCRWITDVLGPLSDNWCHIRCPWCGCGASEPGVILLRITGMTAAGTIEGQMACAGCKHDSSVTLLTHCHRRGCHHYPLVIGKNPVCTSCGGLVCDWRDDDKPSSCRACKWDCSQGEHAFEESFLSG
jgi:hypothetical protein